MKYTRYIIQLLLAIPFYYVSMVIANIILSTGFAVWEIVNKAQDKLNVKSFNNFSIQTDKLLKYNQDFNIFYIVIGLFLSYYLIYLPLKSIYVAVGQTPNKKDKKENKKGIKEVEKESTEKLSALEVLKNKSKKDLGKEKEEPQYTTEEYTQDEKEVDDVNWLEKELSIRRPAKQEEINFEEDSYLIIEEDEEIEFELIEEEEEELKLEEEERRRIERKRIEKEERDKVSKKFMGTE